jgi:hypothetical protein
LTLRYLGLKGLLLDIKCISSKNIKHGHWCLRFVWVNIIDTSVLHSAQQDV